MKGTTNGENKKASAVEMVNITLATDQSSHDALKGTTFTVTYGTYTKSYTWNGTTLTVEIPAYVEYTVTFSDVANHTTPASVTFTAQAGNSRTLNAVYKATAETLTVTVSGLSSGFVVSVINASTGATIGSQTSSTKTYTIADGIKYYVKASSVSGYATPSNSATRTAVAGGTHSVTMTYAAHAGTTNPTNGVWIQDTDGFYHTTSEWDGTYTADCVAVITSSCRFGIALTEASITMQIHSNYEDALENYMAAISDETQAKADYNGAANTTNIMKLQSGTSYAAGWCNAFSFPSGKKGFLPSLGQMWAAYNNKAAVDAAITKAGGTAFTSEHYWTSTFWGVYSLGLHDYRSCWGLHWGGGSVYDYYIDDDYRVRAFAAI